MANNNVKFSSNIERSGGIGDLSWYVVYTVSVMGEFCSECGDNYNEPYIPSHWALYVTVLGIELSDGTPEWTWPKGTDISSKLTEEEYLGISGQCEKVNNYPE